MSRGTAMLPTDANSFKKLFTFLDLSYNLLFKSFLDLFKSCVSF